MNVVYNIDCMEYMRTLPDKYFDLAVCDPPYGININHNIGRRKGGKPSGHKKVRWDAAPPPTSILTSCGEYPKNRLFGVLTTLLAVCRGIVAAGYYGIKNLVIN